MAVPVSLSLLFLSGITVLSIDLKALCFILFVKGACNRQRENTTSVSIYYYIFVVKSFLFFFSFSLFTG